MKKIKKFFNDAAFYFGSATFSNILNFITGIVVRRVLQPALMGLFSEIMLIFEYVRYSHLGIIDSLDKELPYLYGKNDYKGIEEIKNIGFSLCLTIVLCISVCLFIVSSFLKSGTDRLLINGIRIVLLIALLRLTSSLYIVLNRSRNRFSVISKYMILVAILDMAIKIFLVIKFGLYGLLWASVLTLIFGLIYFYKASKERFKFILHFPFNKVFHLFKIGFPIFLTGLIYMSLRNIDRIMIIGLLDREDLGFYTIALMVSVYIVQLPSLIYAVFFPRFYQAYGRTEDIFAIKELFVRPTIIFAYFFPILVGITILLLPLLVRYVLPAYMPGVFPAYLLLLGSSFISLVNMPLYLLIVLNKQIYMVVIGIFSIIVAVILNYIFVNKLRFGLPGIALATAIVYFMYTTILMACAFKNYAKKIFSHLKFFAELYLPFCWALMLLLILQGFAFKPSDIFFKDFSAVFYKAVIFLFGCFPIIYYGNKKAKVLSLLKTYMKK